MAEFSRQIRVAGSDRTRLLECLIGRQDNAEMNPNIKSKYLKMNQYSKYQKEQRLEISLINRSNEARKEI